MCLKGQISIEDLYSPEAKIHPKPPWIKTAISAEILWCPYCNRARKFNKDKHLGVRRCEGCGVSIYDYNIKKFNKLEIFNTRPRKKNRKRN